MADDLDPLSSLRGIAAFRRGNPYELLQKRLRKPHWEMAANVLRKARAVLAVDPMKAGIYVDTALRLPFDENEQLTPAALETHLMLYRLVTDAAEESDPDDSAWLDAAIDLVTASDPARRAELRVVLNAIATDYELPAAELRRVRRTLAQIEPGPSLFDLDFPAESLKERIMTVLALCDRYDDALDERYG